jgi:hypothetical protein
MSLETEVAELRKIAAEAKRLLDVLQKLAVRGGNASSGHRKRIESLVKRLDTASRSAARERRNREIRKLSGVIKAYEVTLSVSGLTASTRKEGTDFGGVLTAAEVKKLREVVRQANKEVKQKKLAASFLGSLLEMADLALSLAGRFAL